MPVRRPLDSSLIDVDNVNLLNLAADLFIWDAWENREPLNYEGELFSFDLSPPSWRPDMVDDPEIPIYVGGVNSYNLRTAGAVCVGLHLHPLSTPEYIRDTVDDHLKAGGRRDRPRPRRGLRDGTGLRHHR